MNPVKGIEDKWKLFNCPLNIDKDMPRPGSNKFIDPSPNIIASAMEMKKNENVRNQILDDCLCPLRLAIPTDIEKNITGISNFPLMQNLI